MKLLDFWKDANIDECEDIMALRRLGQVLEKTQGLLTDQHRHDTGRSLHTVLQADTRLNL